MSSSFIPKHCCVVNLGLARTILLELWRDTSLLQSQLHKNYSNGQPQTASHQQKRMKLKQLISKQLSRCFRKKDASSISTLRLKRLFLQDLTLVSRISRVEACIALQHCVTHRQLCSLKMERQILDIKGKNPGGKSGRVSERLSLLSEQTCDESSDHLADPRKCIPALCC